MRPRASSFSSFADVHAVRVTGLMSSLTSSAQVFSMVASSESEKEDWIRAIGRAIVISRTKSWQEDNEEDR